MAGLPATKISHKNEDGSPEIYEAKFTFEMDLVKYLKLQYPTISKSMPELTEKLSSDLRFTSTGSDSGDALALPSRSRHTISYFGTWSLDAVG